MGQAQSRFCLFSFFSHEKMLHKFDYKWKSVYGVLGTQTQGGRMVGSDKSTKLWRHPRKQELVFHFKSVYLDDLLNI